MKYPYCIIGRILPLGVALLLPLWLRASPTGIRVLADESITTTTKSNNGSNPMWCVGAPLLVRDKKGTVWASISVHDSEAPSYCNTHWELWRRPVAGQWERARKGTAATEREPCPLMLLNDESLVLSIQPKILERDISVSGVNVTWFCQPALAVYNPSAIEKEPRLWVPDFGVAAIFDQHSYRGAGVDSARGELLTMVIDRDDIYRPTWRDAAGTWHPLAPITFPVRACYPEVVLRNRAAHVFAIGDIVEQNEEWKAEKFRVLKQHWDYAFRRLFYTWSPDLAAEGLRPPIEIDSADDTAGWMENLDMLVDAQNRVHLLWIRRNIQYDFMRDRFFPGQPITESVMHAVIEEGRVVARETLMHRELTAGPMMNGHQFTGGRLHLLPDGRLFAVIVAKDTPAEPTSGSGLYVQQLDLMGKSSAVPVRVPLATSPPERTFFTNTMRGGSQPSHDLDLLGTETHDGVISLRYIHVQIP